ncbi:MAG: efflux RND transporter periplasmic adaptor subunit [Caulobacteraceae bacterium]|nr:efflux RND transporter periplasmic adaptor subunit [Caulobacteraceae bacterium]
MVAAALLVGRWLWIRYQVDPWTRDGKIRADVAEIAPDVPGLVTEVDVRDNQAVRRGQLLFVVDEPRYRFAAHQAAANVQSDEAILAEARREAARDVALGELVSVEQREQSASRVREDAAALAQAQATLETARLNLTRTRVLAPVDGIVANLELEPGDYLTAGRQALALVDTDTLRIEGYFEETKLPRIHLGDPVSVHIMGEAGILRGHVVGIAPGIADRERTPTTNLLANISPTFSWVRLAQRVPVRIVLDNPPPGVRLISGRTVTVTILGPGHHPRREAFWPWRWPWSRR